MYILLGVSCLHKAALCKTIGIAVLLLVLQDRLRAKHEEEG
jgi:hypothetical protein